MRFICLSLILFGVNPVWASDFGTILEEFSSEPSTIEEFRSNLFVQGLGHGFEWYAAALAVQTERLFGQEIRPYCPPENLALNAENYVQIGRDYLAKNPETYGGPFGAHMMFALQDAFPCK